MAIQVGVSLSSTSRKCFLWRPDGDNN